jgi:phytoene/squalene synthetase
MKSKFDKLSAECSKLTTLRYSTSFSLGIYFLNKELRQPIYAVYGFVRIADEIVDSFHDYDKHYLLAKFKQDCYDAITQKISLNPVLNSFQKVVNDYGIEKELIDLFLNSMEMDLYEKEYTTEKYDEYILGSAQVVGLMCLRIFTAGNTQEFEKLKPAAMKLGSAFQKVNFLRDINADFNNLSRTYFPNINLEKFTNIDKKIIEKEIEEEFTEALKGIKQLPRSSRRGVYLAYIYYKELLTKIKRLSAERVMKDRIRISNSHKFGLMFDSMIRYKINAL